MQKNIFTQIVVFVSAVLLILMFFFPNYTYLKGLLSKQGIQYFNMLLLIGLYLKDMFRSS